jgi:hypothetical protein
MLLGCAAGGGTSPGSQATGTKMVAASCSAQIESDRQQCEQKCPTATGNEHFSVQHKIAMENAACKQSCSDASEKQAMSCKATR